MTLRGPVLVASNLSPASDEALRQGAALARGLDGRLIVCHIVPELIPDGSAFDEIRSANLDITQSLLGKAREAVQTATDAVLGQAGDNVDIIIAFGSPSAGLLYEAEVSGAGVVVLGPGAVALDVVRHAACAVLVARPSGAGPVVAATDFSESSRPAVQAAADEARRRGAPVHLIHAFDHAVFTARQAPAEALPYLQDASWIGLERLDELRDIARRRLESTLDDLGVRGESAVLSGAASEEIVRYADSVGAQLVVTGTHGRTGLGRLTLGSTAARVIDHAGCSVLVVRQPSRPS